MTYQRADAPSLPPPEENRTGCVLGVCVLNDWLGATAPEQTRCSLQAMMPSHLPCPHCTRGTHHLPSNRRVQPVPQKIILRPAAIHVLRQLHYRDCHGAGLTHAPPVRGTLQRREPTLTSARVTARRVNAGHASPPPPLAKAQRARPRGMPGPQTAGLMCPRTSARRDTLHIALACQPCVASAPLGVWGGKGGGKVARQKHCRRPEAQAVIVIVVGARGFAPHSVRPGTTTHLINMIVSD